MKRFFLFSLLALCAGVSFCGWGKDSVTYANGHIYEESYIGTTRIDGPNDLGTTGYDVTSISDVDYDSKKYEWSYTVIWHVTIPEVTEQLYATNTSLGYSVAPNSSCKVFERRYFKLKQYDLALTVGTGIGKIYYKVNGATTYTAITKSTTVKVDHGSTWYAYAEAKDHYTTETSISNPASGTMADTGDSFEPEATLNQYDLVLTVGAGIDKVYYKVNGASDYSETTASQTVKVDYNTKWYAYATPKVGYKYTETSSSNPKTRTMGADGDAFSPEATKETYSVNNQVSPSNGGEITLDPNKGSAYVYGDTVKLTATPYDNYAFSKWSIDGKTFTDNPLTITVTNTVYCTAYFQALKEYTIETAALPAEGGTVSGAGKYDTGTEVTLVATPSDGYHFVRWEDDSSLSATRQITVTQDATYTATFTGNVYTVEFVNKYTEKKKESEEIEARFGESFGEQFPEVPERKPEGKPIFVGWFDDDGTGEQIFSETIYAIADDYSYYAHWTNLTYYCVAFNGNGATNETPMEVQTIDVGVATPLNKSIYGKIGASFASWTNATGVIYYDQQEVTDIADPGKTNTLYATWRPWTNYVAFVGGSGATGSMPMQTFEYGVGQALASNAFAKVGYAFIGWTNDVAKTFYSDRECVSFAHPDNTTNTLKAVWSPNAYTMTFEHGADASYVVGTQPDTNCYTDVGVPMPVCLYTNLMSVGFAGWKLGNQTYLPGASYTKAAAQSGEVVTFTATWTNSCGVLSDHIGLTNAVLTTSEGWGWTTNGVGRIQLLYTNEVTLAAILSMRVKGPGTVSYKVMAKVPDGKTQTLSIKCGDVVTTVTLTAGYKQYSFVVDASEVVDVCWCVESPSFTMNMKDITWTPGAQKEITDVRVTSMTVDESNVALDLAFETSLTNETPMSGVTAHVLRSAALGADAAWSTNATATIEVSGENTSSVTGTVEGAGSFYKVEIVK